MEPPLAVGEAIIESELLTGGDFAPRDDPDPSADRLGPAIGRAGVIDQARDIVGGASIEIIFFIEIENVNTVIAAAALPIQALGFAPTRFRFRDTFSRVFDHPRATRNETHCIHATAMN